MGRNYTAKKLRLEKEAHPDRFCPTVKCLWRTGGAVCPKHGGKLTHSPEGFGLDTDNHEDWHKYEHRIPAEE